MLAEVEADSDEGEVEVDEGGGADEDVLAGADDVDVVGVEDVVGVADVVGVDDVVGCRRRGGGCGCCRRRGLVPGRG